MELRDEKTIYTYYKNFRKDLIDFVYSVVAPTSPTIRTLFSKKWGKYLKGNPGVHLTGQEQEVFENYATTFEEHLLVAQELQQKKCTFQQIQNFFTYKLGIPTNMKSNRNVKIYSNIDQILKTYQMELTEVNPILNTLPKIQKYCFINYYKKKLEIYQIAESLKCSNDFVIGCLNAVNNAFEAHQTEKLLKNNLPKIEEIELNSILKEEPKPIVASSPKQDSKEKKEDSISKETNTRVEQKLSSINKHPKQESDIRIYQDKEEVLKIYNLTEEQLQNILDEFSMEVKITCTYLIGIDRPKTSIDKVADILKCNIKTVYGYLKTAYKVFAKNQIKSTTNSHEQVKLQQTSITEANTSTHQRKASCKKESNANQNNIIMSKQSKKMKLSLYEGYAEEDEKYVTEVIEYWKSTNLKYYNLIKKVYGPTYDKLNIEVYSQLTKDEKEILDNIHINLRIMAKMFKNENKANLTDNMKAPSRKSGRTPKQSLYEGYAEEDKKYVKEAIEYWKFENFKYYDLVVRVYGSTYDKLNIEVYNQLTKEEKKVLNNIHTSLRKMVETRKIGVKNSSSKNTGRRKKQSLYEGYVDEDKKYVTEVIEYWKSTNKEYYDLIVKVYGPTYDKLNIELYDKLTKGEKNILHKIHSNLRIMVKIRKNENKKNPTSNTKVSSKKTRGRKKLSLYEGYAEEDKKYVTEVIGYWKCTNLKYYDLIIKVYGPTYDKLNIESYNQLTKEEKKTLNNVDTCLKRLVGKIANQSSYGKTRGRKKQSIYEGYAEEDKKYVTEVIEYWKSKNKEYYDLIVKVYGPTYDKLNIELYDKLTKEEKNTLHKIHSNLRIMVKIRKNENKKDPTSNTKVSSKTTNGRKKLSLYEGYVEEDKKYVTEAIEYWKSTNLKYYDLIVKVYGSAYDKLNIEAYNQLTKEEKKTLNNIHTRLKIIVESRKCKGTDGRKKQCLCKDNIKTDSNLDEVEKVDVPISDNQIDAVMGIKPTELPITKQVGVEHSHELEQNNELVVFNHQNNNKKREILIKDIFPSEIIEIEKYVYTQMQSSNPKRQKEAIAAWDRLEKLSNQSIYNNESLQTMMNLLNRVQNSIISMKPIDEDTIAVRIKKL